MPFQHLEHAARMLQRGIGFLLRGIFRLATAIFTMTAAGVGVTRFFIATFRRCTFIEPGFWIILLLLSVPAREKTIKIFRVTKIFAQDRWCIGVSDNVFPKLTIVLEHVVD